MSAPKRIVALIAIAIPPITFYALLARSLTALPNTDDYGAIIGFLLQWKNESGIKHIVEILSFQFNDYRFMFGNAIFGIQYQLLGHVDFKALAILGDLLVLPLFGVLYLIWRQCGRPRDYALLAFVPVSWMLFQLQYEGTLNFATPGLQRLPVIMFALLTCYLVTKKSTKAFLCALVSLLLCIASDGSGLFMIPVGLLFYVQRREFRRLAAWSACCVVACIVYFHGYNFAVEAVHTHSSNNVLSLLQHLSPVYAAAFLGNIATVRNPVPAILFGIVLAGLFVFATYDRLFERRPALYYSALYFFVIAIAVSGLRSSLGLATAANSAYRIYSTVLVIVLYLYWADKLYDSKTRPSLRRVGLCMIGVLLIGFNFASDLGGEKVLLEKKHEIEAAMLRWERHEPSPHIQAISPGDLLAKQKEADSYAPREPFLSDSLREGIFILPRVPGQ